VALRRYHFARRFRVSTGTTPHEYVLQQRVARAQTLLIRTNYPLLDIALMCRFADQRHLNRVFKKHTGVPPGHYRKHN
jgi:AraC family transcriptional regulator